MLLLLYLMSGGNGENQYGWSGITMGTTYQVKITRILLTENEISHLRSQVDLALIEVNRQMSTYDPQSEISRFNDYKDTLSFPVSSEFAGVVSRAIEVSKLSDNLFDITVANLVNLWGFGKKGKRIVPPSEEDISANLKNVGIKFIKSVNGKALKKSNPLVRIDLSAIAKGYGVDVVARILEAGGILNYMVEIGGEVMAKGINAHSELWKIGIDSPGLASLPGQDIRTILALKDVAVATSGDYRNYFEYEGKIYSHTINPNTGKPVTHDLASATVIARDCMTADALATAIMVMGKDEGMIFIEKIRDAEVLMITRRSVDSFSTFQSSGFSQFIYR